MKRPFQFSSTILRNGKCLFACCVLGGSIVAKAQETVIVNEGFGAKGGHMRTGGALVINGNDIGSILLKTCDINNDGMATLAELKEVTAACFKIWDTNTDGSVSQVELSTALKELFPTPRGGGVRGLRVLNGVAAEVAPGDLPTPDAQLAEHALADADSNKDGLISGQELNDFLDKSFGAWDQDGNGSLNAQELNTAFFELSRPGEPGTRQFRRE